jgi:hypothetical protein
MGLIRIFALEVHSDEHQPVPQLPIYGEPKTGTDCEEVENLLKCN